MPTAAQFSIKIFACQVEQHGFGIAENVIEAGTINKLIKAIAELPGEDSRRKLNAYGIRNLLELLPETCELAQSRQLRALAEEVLGPDCFAVRGLLFDKLPGTNFKLGWHQDNVISVRQQRDVPGFSGWKLKSGVLQVQPPPEILAGMLALRVHLDDCGENNGPLRVIPCSYKDGWLHEKLDQWTSRPAVTCLARAGDVIAMRPLLLHASAPAENPTHRRVIHIEYANAELPGGLEWNQQVR